MGNFFSIPWSSKCLLSVTLGLFCGLIVFSQSNKKHVSLKDSLDGKLDLSDYIIDASGFVPIR
jgi:hypothetical protein